MGRTAERVQTADREPSENTLREGKENLVFYTLLAHICHLININNSIKYNP